MSKLVVNIKHRVKKIAMDIMFEVCKAKVYDTISARGVSTASQIAEEFPDEDLEIVLKSLEELRNDGQILTIFAEFPTVEATGTVLYLPKGTKLTVQ